MNAKWMKNLPQLLENDEAKCPDCGKKELQYTFESTSSEYGYAYLWCKACKHAVVLSRVKAENHKNSTVRRPDDLIIV